MALEEGECGRRETRGVPGTEQCPWKGAALAGAAAPRVGSRADCEVSKHIFTLLTIQCIFSSF